MPKVYTLLNPYEALPPTTAIVSNPLQSQNHMTTSETFSLELKDTTFLAPPLSSMHFPSHQVGFKSTWRPASSPSPARLALYQCPAESRQGGAREWAFPVWPPIQLCYIQVVTLCKFQTLFHPKKGQPRTAVRLKWLMCGKVPVNGAATWWVYNKREHPFLQAPRGHYFSVSCSAHHSQYVHAFPHQNVLKSLTVGTVALFIPRLCHPTGAQGARLNKTSDKFTQSNFF